MARSLTQEYLEVNESRSITQPRQGGIKRPGQTYEAFTTIGSSAHGFTLAVMSTHMMIKVRAPYRSAMASLSM
jgi:hypothetical protein